MPGGRQRPFSADPERYYKLVAWRGYSGKQDPAVMARGIQKLDESRAKSRPHSCPEPQFLEDEEVLDVAEATRNTWQSARELLEKEPATFYRLLHWKRAKDRSEEIIHREAEKDAERDRKHKKASEDSKVNPRFAS